MEEFDGGADEEDGLRSDQREWACRVEVEVDWGIVEGPGREEGRRNEVLARRKVRGEDIDSVLGIARPSQRGEGEIWMRRILTTGLDTARVVARPVRREQDETEKRVQIYSIPKRD